MDLVSTNLLTYVFTSVSCVLSQLGAKKGGLGGKKVSKQSFCDLEKKAQAVDKLNERDTAPTIKNSPQPAEESM
jgi:hypothetical protein